MGMEGVCFLENKKHINTAMDHDKDWVRMSSDGYRTGDVSLSLSLFSFFPAHLTNDHSGQFTKNQVRYRADQGLMCIPNISIQILVL